MPTTRKKVIKTVYKDNDSEAEESGDFSDSGSDAKISEQSSSEDEKAVSSVEEFEEEKPKISKAKRPIARRKVQYAKTFISKIRNESQADSEDVPAAPSITVKNLTDADKQLPNFLNLSESDSSEDESPRKPSAASANTTRVSFTSANPESDDDAKMEYQDVWSNNIPDNSEEIAQKTFKELEIHKAKIEQTKASILNYTAKTLNEGGFDVKDLLAQGEEVPKTVINEKKPKLSRKRKGRNDSDSEMEDWEEVKESKALPASGLQVVVDFPDAVARKSKKIDIEMMMKRKMNRVKKEYQVYMHKVHVLCWLGHGNYVSSVLNNQEIMSAVLSLVPSKECYPGQRVDIKYVEQIVKWFTNKVTLKQDKNEHKFKPKAPPLKEIMLKEINNKVVSTKKYMVFIFVSMLRALGLQCRVMFNFVTLPIKPPSSELCSLSTKVKDEKKDSKTKKDESKKNPPKKNSVKKNIPQLDGIDDSYSDMSVDESYYSDSHIMQVDGSDDGNAPNKTRKPRLSRTRKAVENKDQDNEDVTPPKRAKKSTLSISKSSKDKGATQSRPNTEKNSKKVSNSKEIEETVNTAKEMVALSSSNVLSQEGAPVNITSESPSKPKPRQTRGAKKTETSKNLQENQKVKNAPTRKSQNIPDVIFTDENNKSVSSAFFTNDKPTAENSSNRTRSQIANPKSTKHCIDGTVAAKARSKSASTLEKSKYFNESEKTPTIISKKAKNPTKTKKVNSEDQLRVSHRELKAKSKTAAKNDVTADLIDIIETRMSESKTVTPKAKAVKGKIKKTIKEDGDYQPDGELSDEDFKAPTKISPKPGTSRQIDRRVISTDDEIPARDKSDVWCEVYVEELEQWIAVDVVKGKVHCTNEIYNRATHPVCYVVGWDNNNYLKDLTRRYVPHWNTVTRKQRAEPVWWEQAIYPWRGPRTARDKEEDDSLDRMQLDAPLPKSIAEYKNHPLYALKRHLLKYEAIYPPDAATLGFVRNEPVYARECVYICRSRDTWLKEAKVVKLGEKPYKIVKARPKWDKLSNKCITDKPLEIFGPWQVQDYEPPVAENGIVPRNAYGNVELFKECMLPKGTAHLKLPGLNRVAKKLNIDCAPAMTGFDFNGGWSHPVYDGFVVCKEFEEIVTEAWLKDQEDQERREREKTEARVYGNWKKLIRGLMIRERLKLKYGFEEPSVSDNSKKSKGPRFVAKKK